MNCCENLRARPARQQCAHYIAVHQSTGRGQSRAKVPPRSVPASRAATPAPQAAVPHAPQRPGSRAGASWSALMPQGPGLHAATPQSALVPQCPGRPSCRNVLTLAPPRRSWPSCRKVSVGSSCRKVSAWEMFLASRANTSQKNCGPALPRQVDVPRKLREIPAWESPMPTSKAISPKQGRCAAHPAQRPGLGGFAIPDQRIRAILAQRPGSGEIRVRKVPAWESRREGISRLPAKTSEPFSAQKGNSLPRRDLVAGTGRFCAPEAGILPSGDDVPRMAHVVPPWEDALPANATASPKAGRCATRPAQDPCLGEHLVKQQDHLSQAGTICRPPCATSRLGRTTRTEDHSPGEPGFGGISAESVLKPIPTPTPDMELANLTECLPLSYAPPASP